MDDQRTDREGGEGVSEVNKLRWYTLRVAWVGEAARALIRRIRFSLKTLLFAMTLFVLVPSAYRIGSDRGYRLGYDSGTRDTTIRWNYTARQEALARAQQQEEWVRAEALARSQGMPTAAPPNDSRMSLPPRLPVQP